MQPVYREFIFGTTGRKGTKTASTGPPGNSSTPCSDRLAQGWVDAVPGEKRIESVGSLLEQSVDVK